MEHASAKALIAQIQDATEIDEKFDAKVKVVGEYIDHHVKEERNEIFVKARASRGLDLVAMREQLVQRKEELMAEMEVMACRAPGSGPGCRKRRHGGYQHHAGSRPAHDLQAARDHQFTHHRLARSSQHHADHDGHRG